MSHTRPVLLVALSALGLAVLVAPAGSAADPASGDRWPAWRGADGQGIADGARIPLEWSATKNVRWKTALPGRGLSSPVVWGDRIFLTTAHVLWRYEKGSAYVPSPILYDGFVYLLTDRGRLSCLDARTGEVRYEGGRLGASFTASPIAVDGHLLLTSEEGDTLRAEGRPRVRDRGPEPAGRARRGLAGGGRRADLHPRPQAPVLDRRHSRVLIDRPGDNETT